MGTVNCDLSRRGIHRWNFLIIPCNLFESLIITYQGRHGLRFMESCLNANSLRQHIFLGHGRFDSLEAKCNKCRGVKLVQRSFEKRVQSPSVLPTVVLDKRKLGK